MLAVNQFLYSCGFCLLSMYSGAILQQVFYRLESSLWLQFNSVYNLNFFFSCEDMWHNGKSRILNSRELCFESHQVMTKILSLRLLISFRIIFCQVGKIILCQFHWIEVRVQLVVDMNALLQTNAEWQVQCSEKFRSWKRLIKPGLRYKTCLGIN